MNEGMLGWHYGGNLSKLWAENEALVRSVLRSRAALVYVESFKPLPRVHKQLVAGVLKQLKEQRTAARAAVAVAAETASAADGGALLAAEAARNATRARMRAMRRDWKHIQEHGLPSTFAGNQVQEWHAYVANYYELPVLSYRSAVFQHYRALHDAERTRGLPPDASRLYSAHGCVHPPWWVHELIAEVVAFNWQLEATHTSAAHCTRLLSPPTTTTTTIASATTAAASATPPAHADADADAGDLETGGLPPPMFSDESQCAGYLTRMSARPLPGASADAGGRAHGGAMNKRARQAAKAARAAEAAAAKASGAGAATALGSGPRAGAAAAEVRGFVPEAVEAGWQFGEDVVDKPGWIIDQPGPATISFRVKAARGVVKVAYLRTDLPRMGRAQLWLTAAPAREPSPLALVTPGGGGRRGVRRAKFAGKNSGDGIAAAAGKLTEAGEALRLKPLELDGFWEDRFSLTQVAELAGVGRGELLVHVRKVAGTKFKLEGVMSC